jgi:hypothetical protein
MKDNSFETDINSALADVNAVKRRVDSINLENYAYQVHRVHQVQRVVHHRILGLPIHIHNPERITEMRIVVETRYRDEDYKHDLAEANKELKMAVDVLLNLVEEKGGESVIHAIVSGQMDTDSALVHSIESKNLELFEFLLARGANCDRVFVEDAGEAVTVACYVAKHYPRILQKTLQDSEELINTFLAAVRAGDIEFLRNMINFRAKLVKTMLEQEGVFKMMLGQDNAEMAKLFLPYIDAELKKLIDENSEEANGYIAKLIAVIDPSSIDGSLVVYALEKDDLDNLEAVKLLLNEENLKSVATQLIEDERLDLLNCLYEERGEIIIEGVVSSALFTFWDEQRSAEVAGNVEDYSDD